MKIKMNFNFIILLIISIFNIVISENIELISNGNFENQLKDWYITSGYDKEVDFTKPDLVEKSPTPILLNGERSKEKYSILFNKPHGSFFYLFYIKINLGPYDKRPGLVQAIFLKEKQSEEKKNILISFSHLISNISPKDTKGRIIMYINIKYKGNIKLNPKSPY